jgi:hypothetical protein
VVADLDAGQDDGVSADPDIVADDDRPGLDARSFVDLMIVRILDDDAVADQAVPADADRQADIDHHAAVDERSGADRELGTAEHVEPGSRSEATEGNQRAEFDAALACDMGRPPLDRDPIGYLDASSLPDKCKRLAFDIALEAVKVHDGIPSSPASAVSRSGFPPARGRSAVPCMRFAQC